MWSIYCKSPKHFIDLIQGVTSQLSFVYTGVIYYEQKDDDWIVTLFVVKDLESHLEVTIVDKQKFNLHYI